MHAGTQDGQAGSQPTQPAKLAQPAQTSKQAAASQPAKQAQPAQNIVTFLGVCVSGAASPRPMVINKKPCGRRLRVSNFAAITSQICPSVSTRCSQKFESDPRDSLTEMLVKQMRKSSVLAKGMDISTDYPTTTKTNHTNG